MTVSCKSVLVVEDDRDLRQGITDVLESEGYTVLQAEDGQVALNVLGSLSQDDLPGCIILDLMMPNMGGKEFAETLARYHADTWAKIRIIVATARGNMNGQMLQIPLSVEVIRKPMDIGELLSVIEKHCGKRGDQYER